MPNPLVQQGTLNRLRSTVTLPSHSSLNITPSYMGPQFVTVAFDGNFDNLIETATGGVSSPEPYVMATVTVSILRTQGLSASWVAQSQSLSNLGDVSIFPDTTAYPEIDLKECVLQHIDPGAFDGKDPVVRLTIRGIYYINNDLWTL